MFGVIDFARALYAYHFVANAAREGTRYAIVRGSTWQPTNCGGTTTAECTASDTDIESYVQGLATGIGINPNSVTPTVAWPGTGPSGSDENNGGCSTGNGANSPGCIVQVQVVYPFSFIFPFMPKQTCSVQTASQTITASICMTSTSQMVISQ